MSRGRAARKEAESFIAPVAVPQGTADQVEAATQPSGRELEVSAGSVPHPVDIGCRRRKGLQGSDDRRNGFEEDLKDAFIHDPILVCGHCRAGSELGDSRRDAKPAF